MKYKKRASTYVTAVKLDLDTEGFVYRKWGGIQTCKPGDWLVNNQGETHYQAGDYLVYNDGQDKDGYAISREQFETLYKPR